MEQNRYDMFRMNNQMNKRISQQYRMNNMNQPMGKQYPRNQMDQYRFDTNQMNDQQKRMEMMMMMNEQMNGQVDQRMNGPQSYQMNRPNRMFDQRINSVNQMDGQQRMQYRMGSNQMNQLNNRRFKRGADSDFVAYRTMTQTPFQRSHSEVVMQTEPQPIQLVQGSYTQGYSFPTVFQGPVNQAYSMYTAAPLLRRPMVYYDL